MPAEQRDKYVKQVLVVQGLVALTSAVARNVTAMLPQVSIGMHKGSKVAVVVTMSAQGQCTPAILEPPVAPLLCCMCPLKMGGSNGM
jgi:hypothetical protein